MSSIYFQFTSDAIKILYFACGSCTCSSTCKVSKYARDYIEVYVTFSLGIILQKGDNLLLSDFQRLYAIKVLKLSFAMFIETTCERMANNVQKLSIKETLMDP